MDLTQLLVAAALTLLTGAVGWLVRTVGANQRRCDVLERELAHAKALVARVDALDGRADAMGERMAAAEAVQTRIVDLHEDITRVHSRVDEVLKTTSHMSGALSALDRTNTAILEALIGKTDRQ